MHSFAFDMPPDKDGRRQWRTVTLSGTQQSARQQSTPARSFTSPGATFCVLQTAI